MIPGILQKWIACVLSVLLAVSLVFAWLITSPLFYWWDLVHDNRQRYKPAGNPIARPHRSLYREVLEVSWKAMADFVALVFKEPPQAPDERATHSLK